jgi:predicted aspartyl protease
MVDGPRIDVEVHVPDPLATLLSQQGKPIPKPVLGQALIDTGASITAVDDSTITSLGVQPIGVTMVHTPSGSAQQNLYPVRFVFPGSGLPELSATQAIGSVLLPQGIVALIGRTALSSVILVYNGPVGMITLAI